MKRIIIATSLIVIGLAAAISADTVVLTNGRRIQGELLGVFGREIEFEERTGAGRRIVRIPRNEIARIEFVEEFANPVTLDEMKKMPELKGMILLKRGRLSVQPVTPAEWAAIVKRGRGA